VKFETYAIALIRGAILEMLRDEDWVPRSIREKLKALDRAAVALETRYGRPATEHEISAHMGLSVSEVNELMVRMGQTDVYRLDEIVEDENKADSSDLVDLIADDSSMPGDEIEGREIRMLLSQGMDKLPERERLVVVLYYFEGLVSREIARVLGCSESHVYRLHTLALNRLRATLLDSSIKGINRVFFRPTSSVRPRVRERIETRMSTIIKENYSLEAASTDTDDVVRPETHRQLIYVGLYLEGASEDKYGNVSSAITQVISAFVERPAHVS
jgi:FliA/WhiG family RNA polymerase sigma factor